MSAALDARLQQVLNGAAKANLLRVRRVVQGGHGVHQRVTGQACINFCANDYLGLASHPAVARAAQRALEQGTGSAASSLVSGYNREHQALEEELATFTGHPRTLLFSSGWAANLGVLKGLLGKEDVLLADELNHASLIDGGRLSGAQYIRVPHGNPDGWKLALKRLTPHVSRLTLLATDAVFSMDGDLAALPQLSALAHAHDAALMVDDAHGFGVLGQGLGTAAELGAPLPDIFMAGFGKALGTAGAFIGGSAALIEVLIQRARSLVFSTAPPPALAAATRAALRIVAGAEGEALRARLFANIQQFRSGCAERGIALPNQPVATPIQPLILGTAETALDVSRKLFEAGYWVAAIRPPTVPAGSSRLRLTLSAAHEPQQIQDLLNVLDQSLPRQGRMR